MALYENLNRIDLSPVTKIRDENPWRKSVTKIGDENRWRISVTNIRVWVVHLNKKTTTTTSSITVFKYLLSSSSYLHCPLATCISSSVVDSWKAGSTKQCGLEVAAFKNNDFVVVFHWSILCSTIMIDLVPNGQLPSIFCHQLSFDCQCIS